MLFSSIPFLYYFLPIVFLFYFIVPKPFKNFVLLVSSLYFYGCGEPKYLILMSISIMTGYLSGLLIGHANSKKIKKFYLTLALLILVGLLGYFKYADFFVANFNALTGLSIPLLKVTLPIGISFYTFQIQRRRLPRRYPRTEKPYFFCRICFNVPSAHRRAHCKVYGRSKRA